MRPADAAARRLERELARLEPICEQVARRYFIPGGDRDDVLQLARIGCWQALEQWDGRSPIRGFARLLAERRVIEAIIAARRDKRQAQLEARSVVTDRDGLEHQAVELIAEPFGLEERVAGRERLRAVVGALPQLSPLERRSLAGVARGESYVRPGSPESKQADNAIQRARRKVGAALAATDAA